jgi:hypothetical protein
MRLWPRAVCGRREARGRCGHLPLHGLPRHDGRNPCDVGDGDPRVLPVDARPAQGPPIERPRPPILLPGVRHAAGLHEHAGTRVPGCHGVFPRRGGTVSARPPHLGFGEAPLGVYRGRPAGRAKRATRSADRQRSRLRLRSRSRRRCDAGRRPAQDECGPMRVTSTDTMQTSSRKPPVAENRRTSSSRPSKSCRGGSFMWSFR